MRALAAGLILALLFLAGCSDDGGDAGADTDADGGAGGSGGGASGGATGGSGGGSASATGTGGSAPREATLAISATGAYPVNPGFDPTTASVPAGAVVHVTFTNGDVLPVQHNVVFEKMGSSDTIGSGEETTFDVTAPLEPGTIAYYCSIGDHRDRGMEGTLTVTA